MAYATQADLEIEVGGAQKLLELVDYEHTGNLASASCQAVIDAVLEEGGARVRAAVEVKHEPEVIAAIMLEASESKRLLVSLNAALSARIAHEKGTGGQAVPEHVTERADRALGDLDRLAAGTLRIGRAASGAAATLGQQVTGDIDHDEQGTGMSVYALKQHGFR